MSSVDFHLLEDRESPKPFPHLKAKPKFESVTARHLSSSKIIDFLNSHWERMGNLERLSLFRKVSDNDWKHLDTRLLQTLLPGESDITKIPPETRMSWISVPARQK